MATLKDHQQAMVDLLASGSGIPASASRLAHAMHDVLCYLTEVEPVALDMKSVIRAVEANSPGLNDKALAADVEACRVKLTGAGGGPKATPAERRVKELENTVKQLRANTVKLRDELSQYRAVITTPEDEMALVRSNEQAGCRKDDTQIWCSECMEAHESPKC